LLARGLGNSFYYPLEPRPQLVFAGCAYNHIGHLALKEDHQGRDRLDTKLPGNLRLFINIYFSKLHFTGKFLGQLLDYRGNLLAGLAPFRPEIYQDRQFGATDFLHEVLGSKRHGGEGRFFGFSFSGRFSLFSLAEQVGSLKGCRFFGQDPIQFFLIYVKFFQVRGKFEGDRVAEIQAGARTIPTDRGVNHNFTEDIINP
jgi:hypothetical protein